MSENGSGSEIVDVAYGEGWDAGRGAVLGPISSEAAAARDAAGEQYAVVLRQADHPAVVVAHVAWARHYLGLWVYDAQRRRFLEADLRRLEAERVFLTFKRAWAYASDRTPEFAGDAGRVTVELRPDGRGVEIVEPQGDKGGSRHTAADVPEEQRWFPAPGFGQWEGLFAPLGIDVPDRCELREDADAAVGGEDAEPNRRPPEGPPVLVAHVYDSDVVAVEAESPKGPRWECVLSPQMAMDSYGALGQVIEWNEAALEPALAWASEAGREPDAEAVKAVLSAEANPFAEDLVRELARALGFCFARRRGQERAPLAQQ
ncbi:hypothetical protein OOK36_26775 [Streptomyces sp. NBC_00365]|uniref:hypothetical protein n=1 Tax=Streptomyces sp. NBC_00365 TaxID=2975726 RepID=UPI002252EF4F|nr:hypothetical protein [Streptomyces sp. NBC_00365]MCX5092417.1 hypothetical protein [Streptomyces sp. NBC_00365]